MQVAYNENLDGGGSASIEDAVSVTKMFLEDQRPKNVLEMFSGPGFWGFGLLDANIGIEQLELADKYGIAEDSINETIKNNNLQNVIFHLTDCFNRILIFFSSYFFCFLMKIMHKFMKMDPLLFGNIKILKKKIHYHGFSSPNTSI